MYRMGLVVVGLVLAGCTQPGECGQAECQAICDGMAALEEVDAEAPAAASESLTEFEKQLVDPILTDVREGIRPFTPESVGVCKGQGKVCEEYLGLTPGELPPGRYMVRAELRVPKVGEPGTWKVKFDTECTTTKKTASGESSSTSTNSREYDVRYAGNDRGYRLSPLFSFESPSSGGARSCAWKLIGSHPDGEKVIEGSFSTPAAE